MCRYLGRSRQRHNHQPETLPRPGSRRFYMGIGETIWEEVLFDKKTGKLLNGNFAEYRLPTALDMPPVLSLTLDDSWEPNGPYGLKEVGEGHHLDHGRSCQRNYDAIGVSMTELPITYESLAALKDKK